MKKAATHLLTTIAALYRGLWRARDDFLRLALVPAGILLIIQLLIERSGFMDIVAKGGDLESISRAAPLFLAVGLGYLFCIALFMRNWLHLRAFLARDIGFLGLRLPWAFWRFVFAALSFALLLSLLLDLLLSVLAPLFGAAVPFAIGIVVILYASASCSFYFVALALQRPLPLRQAIRLARPVTPRLIILTLLVQVPLGLLQLALANILVYGHGADLAPWASAFLLIVLDLLRLALIADVLFFFFGAAASVEVTA
ncbi:MAG TPA: hypothetical protein VHL08_06290 [Dongiaceae bacterium]|jgi:hypothetical protein|nr:hypothetical protein [Dongiaceae bacterium]